MKEKTMNFKTWLLAQQKRRDPVGDLARELDWDLKSHKPEEPPLPKRLTPLGLIRYIEKYPGSGGLDAAAEARQEWRKLKNQTKKGA